MQYRVLRSFNHADQTSVLKPTAGQPGDVLELDETNEDVKHLEASGYVTPAVATVAAPVKATKPAKGE